jgi:hypothetical protein
MTETNRWAFVNNISPVAWKSVLTGWLQAFSIVVFWLGWLIDIIICVVRKLPTDFHETSLGLMFAFLAGLSGFTLYGRITDRKTDYGYVERVNAGKVIDASTSPTVVATGDSPTIVPIINDPPSEVAHVSIPRARHRKRSSRERK